MSLSSNPINEVPVFTRRVYPPIPGSPVLAADIQAGEQAFANRTAFLGLVPSMNFGSARQNLTMALVPFGSADAGPNFIAWNATRGAYYIVGNDNAGSPIVSRSYNGDDWIDDSSGLPGGTSPNLLCVAAAPADGFLWVGASNGTTVFNYGTSGGTWGSHTLPLASPALYGVAFDPYQTAFPTFLFWGSAVGAAPNPTIWKGVDLVDHVSSTYYVLTNAVSHVGAIRYLAVGAPGGVVVRIAIFVPNTPGARRLWLSVADPLTVSPWTDAGEAPFADPVNIAYGARDGVFLVAESTGEVWKTSNGSTWTQCPASGFLFTNIAERDGVWFMSGYSAEGESILGFSYDAGTTWTRVPYPLPQGFAAYALIPGDSRVTLAAWNGDSVLTASSIRTP